MKLTLDLELSEGRLLLNEAVRLGYKTPESYVMALVVHNQISKDQRNFDNTVRAITRITSRSYNATYDMKEPITIQRLYGSHFYHDPNLADWSELTNEMKQQYEAAVLLRIKTNPDDCTISTSVVGGRLTYLFKMQQGVTT